MITGLRQESLQNLVLNEGAFLIGFNPSKYATAAALEAALVDALDGQDDTVTLLGATLGGGNFHCVPTTRQISIDGLRGNVKGVTQVDSWEVNISGTLKEIRPEVFKHLAMCGEMTQITNLTTIKVHGNVTNDDYISNLVWVGSTPNGMAIISLTNVLNTAGIVMTFADKNEATIPFTFTAHTTSLTGDAYMPCEVRFLTATPSTSSNL